MSTFLVTDWTFFTETKFAHIPVSVKSTRSNKNCCTAMWKGSGKTATLLRFLDSLFQKERQMRDASSGDKTILR
jgi:hypothetical protein